MSLHRCGRGAGLAHNRSPGTALLQLPPPSEPPPRTVPRGSWRRSPPCQRIICSPRVPARANASATSGSCRLSRVVRRLRIERNSCHQAASWQCGCLPPGCWMGGTCLLPSFKSKLRLTLLRLCWRASLWRTVENIAVQRRSDIRRVYKITISLVT